MTSKKSALTAAMVTALVIGASACGSDGGSGSFDGMSAEEVADASREATLTLTSMSFDMDMVDSAGDRMKMSLKLGDDGHCEGTVAMDDAETEFITAEGMGYLKPNAAFFEGEGIDAAEMEEVLDGRWMAVPEEQNAFGQFCDASSMLSGLEEADSSDGDWDFTDNESIDGTDTVGLKVEEGDGTTHLNVADDSDNPYIVRMTREGDEEGEVTFGSFNESFDIQAPDEADVVTQEEMAGL